MKLFMTNLFFMNKLCKELTLMLLILLISCGSSKNIKELEKNDKIPYRHLIADDIDIILSYKRFKTKKVGFLDMKGSIVIEPIFNNCTSFYGDYANVILDSSYGFIDKKGNYKIFNEYDKVFWYYSDVGFAVKNKRCALIHRNGKLITSFKFESISKPHEGYFPVVLHGKNNFIDSTGKIIFKNNIYLKGSPVYNSMTIIYDSEKTKNNKNPKQGLIDVKGKIIIEPIYEEVDGYFSNKLMEVKDQNKFGMIDMEGNVVIPIQYDEILGDFKNDLLVVKKDKKYGAINVKNEIVIPFIYDKMKQFSEGVSQVLLNKKSGYINNKNEIIIPIEIEYAWQGRFQNGLAVFKSNNKYGYINLNGEIIVPAIYDSALPFKNDLAVVRKNGLTGFINKKGKVIIPFNFDNVWQPFNDRIRFNVKGNK